MFGLGSGKHGCDGGELEAVGRMDEWQVHLRCAQCRPGVRGPRPGLCGAPQSSQGTPLRHHCCAGRPQAGVQEGCQSPSTKVRAHLHRPLGAQHAEHSTERPGSVGMAGAKAARGSGGPHPRVASAPPTRPRFQPSSPPRPTVRGAAPHVRVLRQRAGWTSWCLSRRAPAGPALGTSGRAADSDPNHPTMRPAQCSSPGSPRQQPAV